MRETGYFELARFGRLVLREKDWEPEAGKTMEELSERIEQGWRDRERFGRLFETAEAFGLWPEERYAVFLALLPELDGRFGDIFELFGGTGGRAVKGNMVSFVPLQELITYETGRVEASGEKHKDRIRKMDNESKGADKEVLNPSFLAFYRNTLKGEAFFKQLEKLAGRERLLEYEKNKAKADTSSHKQEFDRLTELRDSIQAYEQKQSRTPQEESDLNDKRAEAAKAVDAFKGKSAPKGFKQRVLLGGNDYMTATKEEFKRFLEGQRLNSRIELRKMGIEELAELVLARGDIDSLLQYEMGRKKLYEEKSDNTMIEKHRVHIDALEKAKADYNSETDWGKKKGDRGKCHCKLSVRPSRPGDGREEADCRGLS